MLPSGLQSNRVFIFLNRIFPQRIQIALALGIFLHLLGFFIFRAVSKPLPVHDVRLPFVVYLSPQTLHAESMLEEQAALFDSAPIFMPGSWNSAQKHSLPNRVRAFSSFPAYEPEISFSNALLTDIMPFSEKHSVTTPADLLSWQYWNLSKGFVGEDITEEKFESNGVFAEVCRLNGQILLSMPTDINLVTIQAEQPVVYYLRIEAGGRSLGRPTLYASSGDLTFDTAAYAWLVDSGLSAGLPAGLFEISIFP